jgi:hypothetical protein
MFNNFHLLSIQLPIHYDANPDQFFRLVAAGLLQLAPVLRDLRIFFIGEDIQGNSNSHLGCSLRSWNEPPSGTLQTLPKEGSFYAVRGVLFRTLKHLFRLRNLVLSNINYPLLQSAIGQKLALQSLYLVTDSRSSLHKYEGGPLIAWRPPAALKYLQISANAVLGAINVPLKAMETLEDLTFIIPSKKWQRDEKWDWLEQVAILIRNIALRAKRMQRFRFCIEENLEEKNVGPLLDALKRYLPHTCLQVLEIHMDLESNFFAREFMEALPPTLQRLYISQELVNSEVIVETITARYFGPKDPTEHADAGNLAFIGYEFFDRETVRLKMLRLNARLLDRQRNVHLLDHPDGCSFGGGKVPLARGTLQELSIEELGEDVMSSEDIPEEALAFYRDEKGLEGFTEAEVVFYAEGVAGMEERMPGLAVPDCVVVGEREHWMTV